VGKERNINSGSGDFIHKRRALFVVLPLWFATTVARVATRIYDQSLTDTDVLILVFVLVSLATLFFLLVKSIDHIPGIMIALFATLSINVLALFFQVLWTSVGGLVRENPRFLELAFWFPLVTLTAYLAFDIKKGLQAIAGFWAIVIPVMVVYLLRSPGTEAIVEKLTFLARFLVMNALFVLLVDLWARVNAHTLSHENQARIQKALANTDDLTGIPNRRAIMKRLEMAVEQTRQTGGIFSVIAFDIQSFKQVNDRFGHPYGDKILIEVAKKGKGIIRAVDTIARFGGDEFLILLENTNETVARKIAERFRDLVRNIELPDGSRLDVAIGIASSDRHPDPYEMISAADRDLYRPQTEKEVKK